MAGNSIELNRAAIKEALGMVREDDIDLAHLATTLERAYRLFKDKGELSDVPLITPKQNLVLILFLRDVNRGDQNFLNNVILPGIRAWAFETGTVVDGAVV
ncbi:MAG TPA: hypothetical protein VJ246_02885 [Patescibacteria group bacterium]|nr:hypothetical protein [Patescibacteria group bacterium]